MLVKGRAGGEGEKRQHFLSIVHCHVSEELMAERGMLKKQTRRRKDAEGCERARRNAEERMGWEDAMEGILRSEKKADKGW